MSRRALVVVLLALALPPEAGAATEEPAEAWLARCTTRIEEARAQIAGTLPSFAAATIRPFEDGPRLVGIELAWSGAAPPACGQSVSFSIERPRQGGDGGRVRWKESRLAIRKEQAADECSADSASVYLRGRAGRARAMLSLFTPLLGWANPGPTPTAAEWAPLRKAFVAAGAACLESRAR